MTQARASERFHNIDLLRAISIASVLVFHYTARWPAGFYGVERMPFVFPYGRFGVDVFFSVSGFCIFMTLASSSSLAEFLAKRLSRIQPAYMAAALLTFAVVGAVGLPGWAVGPGALIGNMLWVTVAVPNWPMVDGAYWSLVVELKFYLLIGVLFFLVRGRNVAFWWALWCGAAALADAVLFARHLDGVAKAIRLATIDPYAASFLVGLIAWESRSGWTLRLGLATLICCACLLVSPRFDVPGMGLAIGVATGLMLRATWLRVPAPVTYLGLISYALYLVHQNIGFVVIRTLAGVVPDIGARIALATLVAVAGAALLHHSVELRWRRPLAQAVQRALARLLDPIAPLNPGAVFTAPRPARQAIPDRA